MEAFSLLKFWHTSAAAKAIVTSTVVASPCSSDGEDGPYYDLEFALPEGESGSEEDSPEKTMENHERSLQTANEEESETGNGVEELSEDEIEDDEDEEGEVKIALTPHQNHELALSPSEELFYKGDLVSIGPTSIILNDSEENSKFPVFLLKSATKFRVLLLKLKKSKSVNGMPEKSDKMEKIEANEQENSSPQENRQKQSKISGKFLTVMCKVEDVRTPLVSLFNSSKDKHGGKGKKNNIEDSDSTAASEERKVTKEVVQKYLKMVKPLYVRVSRRYTEKLRFSGQLGFSPGASKRIDAVSPPPDNGAETAKAAASTGNVNAHQKQAVISNNLQAGLKVVRKHLGKSRSASAVAPPVKMASSRHDDSLLQLHDGIQGAILHCKNSFNAKRDAESSMLSRSVSDPSYEKSVIMPTDSSSSTSTSPFSGEET